MAQEGNRNNRTSFRGNRPVQEFEQQIVDLARVTRVMAGGKRMRFRACVVIGDKKGRVGWAVAKGADVTIAVNKAVAKAKKNMIKVIFVKDTIPHQIEVKFKAAKLMLKPAVAGTGIIAGGAARSVLEMAGTPNVYGKILSGTTNKLSIVQATFKALQALQYPTKVDNKDSIKVEEDETNATLVVDEDLENKQKELLKKEGVEGDLGSKNILKTLKK